MAAGEESGGAVSGFLFGSLAFQHLNADSDTEGFLLGEIKAEAKNSITDSQLDDIEVVHTIDIQKHIPCYWLFSFYNSAGEVDERALQKILLNQEKNVIGWYKFRRNTNQTMTFRERLLHRNLQKHLKNQQLVFFLFTSKLSRENGSTHSLEYTLYKPQGSFIERIPISVTNLGMSEQQDYKTFSGPSSAGGYSRAMKKHRLVFFDQEGSLKEVQRIKGMYGTLQEELKTTCLKVEESERSVERLLTDVQQLRKMVSEKKKLYTLIPGERQNHDLVENNIHLCQALKKVFPNSKLLQSVSITRDGQVVPVQCHNEDNRVNVKDTFTRVSAKSIHVSSSERANASGITCKRKAKNCLNRPSRGKKRRTVWPKVRRSASKDSEDSENDSVNILTGSENEGDVLDQYSNDLTPSASPTF
ncbi:BRCA1-A complex subunit Abraxas 1 isoform X1 [Chiloscyllium plagiosum]|uniref:BRCA1-A complex subunit Abraxas 1 isoform X1 n=1 Tax=Chiloscyllium plagiosum TaxID=36176 RepID=UPI001CB84422|nr:BRCA1-A complex subunit Abraxas 1 isoform X1 [Chiloscyllium plagiosum]